MSAFRSCVFGLNRSKPQGPPGSRFGVGVFVSVFAAFVVALSTTRALAEEPELTCGWTPDLDRGRIYCDWEVPSGETKILVILCNFVEDPYDPNPPAQIVKGRRFDMSEFIDIVDPADAESIVFDNRYPDPWEYDTINDWYRDASFDHIHLTGEVVGYYMLDIDVYPRPCTPGGQGLLSLADAIKAQAVAKAHDEGGKDVGLDENRCLTGAYDRVLIAVPPVGCAGGWGGGFFATVTTLQPRLTVHELGHAFGLGHVASAWDCGNGVFEGGRPCGACKRWEYGNPIDVMGSGWGTFIASSKDWLGWFTDPTPTATVTEGATYTLTPLETPGGLKALYIPVDPDRRIEIPTIPVSEHGIQVDFRQPIGFDELIAEGFGIEGIFDGVYVHDVQKTRLLLDNTPESQPYFSLDLADGALTPGQEFLSPADSLRITALSLTGEGEDAELTVQVQFGTIEVDLGDDLLVDYPDEVMIDPVITGGNPPYTCEWTPSCGLDDPDSCTVTAQYAMASNDPEVLYTLAVYDSTPGSVPGGDRIKVAYDVEGNDCNENGIPDPYEIEQGFAEDCDDNGIPDSCGPDCNLNGLADSCDIDSGLLTDDDQDGFPDECAIIRVAIDVQPDTWEDAITSLSTALARAKVGGGAVKEIWVARGTYIAPWVGQNWKAGTFELANGTAVYGGFVGNETTRDQRDPATNVTILSGDLNGDDLAGGTITDNVAYVLTAEGVDSTAVLDGFTVTGASGLIQLPDYYSGGGSGIRLDNASPTIRNCIIVDNNGTEGAGMVIYGGDNPTLINCAFIGNYSQWSGGAVRVASSDLTAINCLFSGNHAHGSYGGGAIRMYTGGNLSLSNCTFSANSARTNGGAIYVREGTAATLDNCILWGNTSSDETVTEQQIFADHPSAVTVNHSCIQGGWTGPGTANISIGPMLVDPDGPDNVLGTPDDDLRLFAQSPCIDAGDNNAIPLDTTDLDDDEDTSEPIPWDLGGDARVSDGNDDQIDVVDMGAYENLPVRFIAFVDADASPGGDGMSWATAYDDLQDALATASDPGNGVLDIWVASANEFPYKPDGGTGDPDATFDLVDGVSMYGGFVSGDQARDDRDPVGNVTVLSGDLDENDVGDLDDPSRSENSHHVLTASAPAQGTTLDSFTIIGGNAYGGVNETGGGLYIDGGDMTVRRCTFRENQAWFGGGLRAEGPALTVRQSTFLTNQAVVGGGAYIEDAPAALTDCFFAGNVAASAGGGMYNLQADSTLTNCVFSGNTSQFGGGFANSESDTTLVNCTVINNLATDSAGGVFHVIYPATPLYLTVVNSILWGNSDTGGTNEPAQIQDTADNEGLVVDYTDIEALTGNLGGEGNIGDDPMFVDADGPDDDPGTLDDDIRFTGISPCVDAGDDSVVMTDTDFYGYPRISGAWTVDMGAYEAQCSSSLRLDAPEPDPDLIDYGYGTRNRYLAFKPGNADAEQMLAIRVMFESLPPPFDAYDGKVMWVGAPREVTESPGSSASTPAPTFTAAPLVCDPYYADWGSVDVLHVYDKAVVPGGLYAIRLVPFGCPADWSPFGSNPLDVTTSAWGDLVGDLNPPPPPWDSPNGTVDFNDVGAVTEKFGDKPNAPSKSRVDLTGHLPNHIIDFMDIQDVVSAFLGDPYPYDGPVGRCDWGE